VKEMLANSKKSILALLMVFVLAVSMVGCSDSDDDPSDKDQATDKAKKYAELCTAAQTCLTDSTKDYAALDAAITAADAKLTEFTTFVEEKNLAEADLAAITAEHITASTVTLTEVKTQKAAIDNVIAEIAAIGTVTLESKASIESARAAYEALADAGKQAKVNNSQTLGEAENALTALETGAVTNVTTLITALPEAATVTLENLTTVKADYEAALAAYNALPADLKASVDTTKMTAVAAAIAAVEMDIVSVAAIAGIELTAGETPELPTVVSVTLGNNTVAEAAVVWDTTAFDNTVVGETTLTGTITTTETMTNTKGLTATVTVTVTADVTAPVVTLTGEAVVYVTNAALYVEAGATAVDAVDGTVDVVVTGTVDAADGSYTITYTATDAAGNAGTKERTVIVDSIAPVVTLNGDAAVTLNVGDTYEEAGATATDDNGAEVTITGTVDTATAGTYTVKYTAVDKAGNMSAEVTRTVTVLAEAGDYITAMTGVNNGSEIAVGGKTVYNYTFTFTVSEEVATLKIYSADTVSGLPKTLDTTVNKTVTYENCKIATASVDGGTISKITVEVLNAEGTVVDTVNYALPQM